MSDDETADRASSGSPVFPWRGVLLGPGLIRHEKLTGRDRPGIEVLACVVCGQLRMRAQTNPPLGIRIMEQLVRPRWEDEPAAVVGWMTSCKHVIWAGVWELVIPGPGRIARWEPRSVFREQRDSARRRAFDAGRDLFYVPRGWDLEDIPRRLDEHGRYDDGQLDA